MNTRSSTGTAALVVGSLAAFAGMGLGIAGGALVWAHSTQRDSAGYYSTSAERLETSSFALKSDQIDLGSDASDYRWVPGDGANVVRLQATSKGTQPLFVGIARSADVERYLAGSAHAEVTDFDVDPFRPEMRQVDGSARPAPPASQAFWAGSAIGTGRQTLDWKPQAGNWTVVVMNADGSPGVDIDVAVGAKTDVLLPIGLVAGGVALVMVGGGIALVVFGANSRRRQTGPYVAPDRSSVRPPLPVPSA